MTHETTDHPEVVLTSSIRILNGADLESSCFTWRMIQADVNRDRRQYEETDDDRDARLISYLIDVLLLGRHAEFPHAGSSAGESAIANWSLVGRAMTGRHRPD